MTPRAIFTQPCLHAHAHHRHRYTHHGLQMEFSGAYSEYFGMTTNVAAVAYLMAG